MRNLPKGNDGYSKGFRAGCRTFFSVVGNGSLRSAKVEIDGYKLTGDPLYTRGFLDAASYCTHYLDWDTH
jgi:hypothetical protein